MLISTVIALIMAGLCVSSYLQVRKVILRSEALMGLHDQAQAIYSAFYRDFTSCMPTCGMVIRSQPGSLDLIMMKGKEDSGSWDPLDAITQSDLVWDEWRWSGSQLGNAVSSPTRSFMALSTATFHGSSYSGDWFLNMPQPRRWLDPVAPTASLDDNIYFPSGPGAPSRFNALQDVGDFSDLQKQMSPVVGNISDVTLQCVFHDGSTRTFDGSASGSGTLVIPGVWLDGRLAPRATDPPDYITCPIPQRPELVRLRLTLNDTAIQLHQVYSFAFALPGLTPSH